MEEKGEWKTIKGRHVFIKDGQSLEDAMAESGKFNNIENKPRILYHQTTANSLDEFDESKRKAGLSDTGTPKGIFLKETDEDIGLEGKNQLKFETTINNPLEIKNRDELKNFVSKNSERYKNIVENENKSDDYYAKKVEELEQKWDHAYEREYYAQGEEKEKFKQETDLIDKQLNDTLDQWQNSGRNVGKIAQEEITNTLRNLGYDSVILDEDEGSFGRKIKSYIVFDKEQLKESK